MDIESDDSERWEDFFGSTTELESILGIYDSLTSTLDANLNNSSSSDIDNGYYSNASNYKTTNLSNTNLNESTISNTGTIKSKKKEDSNRSYLETDFDYNFHNSSTSKSFTDISTNCYCKTNQNNIDKHDCNTSGAKSLDLTSTSSNSAVKHRTNIRVLSPNVQRIITSSDVKPVDTVDIEAVHNHLQHPAESPILNHRFIKKSCIPANVHKAKLSHIPLSKITGKLTQSGYDLVDTFDSSSEYLDSLKFANRENKKNIKKPATPAINNLTNASAKNVSPFNFNSAPFSKSKAKLSLPKSLDSISHIEIEKLAQTTQCIEKNSLIPMELNTNSKEFIATKPLSSHEIIEAVNYSIIAKNIEDLSFEDNSPKKPLNKNDELVEAINKPLISKSLMRSSSTGAGSPLLTYARSKCFANKAYTLSGDELTKLSNVKKLEELEETSKALAENLDRLTDIKPKFSPKDSSKYMRPMLPDIAKLKHRPLSSSSICSTSSSSSSGSDQLHNKLNTSYLASVESLADQSENEITDLHVGLSVYERACKEIIDSERSYVEDLGQVIKGYLLDWKERACLRYDELNTLFSNIEDIYDFNKTLLKQLTNCSINSTKIAKCFIELRDGFDVYTTYCTSYPEAISLLTKLLQATHTNALLASTQKMLQHTLPLGSYLLKPVQRILKYHLLLDNLRKHSDVSEVVEAYEIMRQVAHNIDQVKRKLEQQSRVKELAGILDGWLGPELTVLGELRQEGLLMESSKPRLVFLFSTMLILTKPKEDNRLQFKSYIHQNNLMLSEHLSGDPTSFYVIPYDEPRNQIKLTAKNREQKRLWAQHIKAVILEKFDNIPNRVKELVYKLGDEEDRLSDKHTWKWSLHSTSTPVYLERRNQYRRTEIRNRSKFKRKTLTNSNLFENEPEASTCATNSPTKVLQRSNSMDEMLQTLKIDAVGNNTSTSFTKDLTSFSDQRSSQTENILSKEEKGSILRKDRSLELERQSQKSFIFSDKAFKERCKSVPKINSKSDLLMSDKERFSFHSSHTNLDLSKPKSSKAVDIKQYNQKILPKRIATLKKQRISKKETSKFYMDINEFQESTQTILKITESSDNLLEYSNINKLNASETDLLCEQKVETDTEVTKFINENKMEKGYEVYNNLSCKEKNKMDAQIVLDLLQNNKEYEKIYKRSNKKRFSVKDRIVSNIFEIEKQPPRPPSTSPPPLELENELNDKQIKNKTDDDNPIYESLLRNVHVPYKFATSLNGLKNNKNYIPREKTTSCFSRPESDYVMLAYSPEGILQCVDNDILRTPKESNEVLEQVGRDSSCSSESSSSTLKRDSQSTVVHVDCSAMEHISELSNILGEDIYSKPIKKKGSKTNKKSYNDSHEDVSNSEVSFLTRLGKSVESNIHFYERTNKSPVRRKSEASEMYRQCVLHRQGSKAVGERMAHVDYADPTTLFKIGASESLIQQRDSVFSLTSSSDSVCDKRSANSHNIDVQNNFKYEDNVEASLEQDFRDSAIYSDDNERRLDCDKKNSENIFSQQILITSPTPISTTLNQSTNQSSRVIMCPPNLNAPKSRSWVLQQIEQFNK